MKSQKTAVYKKPETQNKIINKYFKPIVTAKIDNKVLQNNIIKNSNINFNEESHQNLDIKLQQNVDEKIKILDNEIFKFETEKEKVELDI